MIPRCERAPGPARRRPAGRWLRRAWPVRCRTGPCRQSRQGRALRFIRSHDKFRALHPATAPRVMTRMRPGSSDGKTRRCPGANAVRIVHRMGMATIFRALSRRRKTPRSDPTKGVPSGCWRWYATGRTDAGFGWFALASRSWRCSSDLDRALKFHNPDFVCGPRRPLAAPKTPRRKPGSPQNYG